jgi:hypothetical protein
MKTPRAFAAAVILLLPAVAAAQSNPGLTLGQVPSPTQWNSYFAAKQDVLGFTPLNRAGGVMSGPLVTIAPTTSAAGFRLTPGVAPISPVNGDIWTTTAGVFARINGSTQGPIGTAPCPTCAVTNAANTFTATQNIETPANTLTVGLNIVQSGPTSGTTAGPWSYNLITVTDSGNVLSGTGHDAFDLLQADSSAFRVNATHGGDEPPIRIVGTFASNYTGVSSNQETVGVIGSTYSNTTVGALWGSIGYSSIGPAGTVAALIPVASEVSAQTGSSVLRRMAYAAITEAPVQGSIDDTVLLVAGQNAGRGTPGGFKNIIRISNNWFGAAALDPLANFFSADSATTITNFINAGNVEIGGEIFLFKNLNVPGAPPGFVLPTHVAGAFQYGGTSTNGIPMIVNAFTGPALFVGTRANTSSTAPSTVLSGETIVGISAQPYNGTSYNEVGGIGVHAAQNQTASAWGSYISFLTTPLNTAVIAEAGRFGPSGALLVGTTTDAVAGVANLGVGVRILNAATSGNYLRGNGTNFVSAALNAADLTGTIPGVRVLLTTSTTFYVRTDGNNSNTCLTNSAGGACLTIQGAYDKISGSYDLGGQAVTIQVADGTYTTGTTIAQAWTGGGSITIKGNNSTPANVLISTTSADAFSATAPLPGTLAIQDLKIVTTTSGFAINVSAPGVISYQNINFGAAAGLAHIHTDAPGARILCTGNYTISGGSTYHWWATGGSSQIFCRVGKTITFVGTPAFSFFAGVYTLSSAIVDGLTFSPSTGAFTGARYDVAINGVIFTNSAGPNYFPGSAAGCTAPCASGGQYL